LSVTLSGSSLLIHVEITEILLIITHSFSINVDTICASVRILLLLSIH